MHPDLHKYLDREIDQSALSPEALAELAEWEALDTQIAQRRALRAPAGMVSDVMRALPPERTSALSRITAFTAWLLTPRPIAISPIAPMLGAAAVVAFIMFMPRAGGVVPTPTPTQSAATVARGDAAAPAVVYVQFTVKAADAQTVAVAGDFNSWSADAGMLRDPDGDGVWVGLVPLEPGVHKYMFVMDGKTWVTDPRAESYVDDGFGMRNAVIAVGPPVARAI
jgi:hypothetical protein